MTARGHSKPNENPDESFPKCFPGSLGFRARPGQKILPGANGKYKFRCRPPARGNLSRSNHKRKTARSVDDGDYDEGIVGIVARFPNFMRRCSTEQRNRTRLEATFRGFP